MCRHRGISHKFKSRKAELMNLECIVFGCFCGLSGGLLSCCVDAKPHSHWSSFTSRPKAGLQVLLPLLDIEADCKLCVCKCAKLAQTCLTLAKNRTDIFTCCWRWLRNPASCVNFKMTISAVSLNRVQLQSAFVHG